MDQPPAGRGRPARMPRALRRAQVLAIAQELFTSEGFHHVSMDDIADRAEVSKPVLYRHFPSKLDLYLTVVDARGDELPSAAAMAQAAATRRLRAPDGSSARDTATLVARLAWGGVAGFVPGAAATGAGPDDVSTQGERGPLDGPVDVGPA